MREETGGRNKVGEETNNSRQEAKNILNRIMREKS